MIQVVPRLLPRFVLRLPAHVINGISVALGIALVQGLTGAAGGMVAALTASGGAIFASLADVPNTPGRTWRRVLTAALVGCISSLFVTALHPYTLALGAATVLLAFASSMALAWGPRAGPISFVALVALVFTMAAPPTHGVGPVLVHVGWTSLGAALYLGWAMFTSRLLQPRYRTLALANALQAMADLLRSRAVLLTDDVMAPRSAPPLQDWIQRQVTLDERLQTARDLLFAATDAPGTDATRHIAALLIAVEMRDTLLASELDLELLSRDAASEQLRSGLAGNLNGIADVITGMAAALREPQSLSLANSPVESTQQPPSPDAAAALRASLATLEADPARTPLAHALHNRAVHMNEDLSRLQAAMQGDAVNVPLSRDELRLFESPEGWPLSALRPHLTLGSPVLRHALRSAVALGSAYFLALALPWASHPHWLVLSVAVVLRGNLEQTLARRDERVAGTVLGCLLVMVLSLLHTPWLSTVIFLLAIGVAHSFVMARYLVTAIAATVMALLQAHLVHPAGGFGVGERLADTLLGALLAWGFSYVLPWWERRGLSRLVDRVLLRLRDLAAEALRWPEAAPAGTDAGAPAPDLALRLARREVYDVIGAIATAAQRTGAEPADVRVPMYALATLLMRCHALLAQLAAVRTMLMRKGEQLDDDAARAALQTTAAQVRQALHKDAELPSTDTPDTAALPAVASVATSAALSAALPGALPGALPAAPTDAELLPWLLRRLNLTGQAARQVAQAAAAVRAAGG